MHKLYYINVYDVLTYPKSVSSDPLTARLLAQQHVPAPCHPVWSCSDAAGDSHFLCYGKGRVLNHVALATNDIYIYIVYIYSVYIYIFI